MNVRRSLLRNRLLVIIALIIVVVSAWYSRELSNALATTERLKVEHWVEAQKTILNSAGATDQLNLAARISADNTDIPIIETNEQDVLTGNFINIDSANVSDTNALKSYLKAFKQAHPPIVMVISDSPYLANKYYYGESKLQTAIEWFPLLQLLVVAVFVVLLVVSQRTHFASVQNQTWVGLAKETAHQLGTPLTSLKGWIELLRDDEKHAKLVMEMDKDIERLQLISDRFSKIGSTPQLQMVNIPLQIEQMVAYMKKRSGKGVQFGIDYVGDIEAMVNPPLFDWVIENLIKNALDAMQGAGSIAFTIAQQSDKVTITIADSGKGIPKHEIAKVFDPGFTTKKRGWGLGLTLTKRIIEYYHKGSIAVKSSEVGKGTTFAIVLPVTSA